jgi:hypothetical protein
MLVLLFVFQALALSLPLRYTPGLKLDGVEHFHDKTAQVNVAVSPSKLKFADLNKEAVADVEKLFAIKAEYGEMFGFKKWKAQRHRLQEDPRGRALLIEGNYENLAGRKIHFLEVYWADNSSAREFLFTSEKKTLQLEQFAAVFAP